jgi:hypothetical protein
MIIYGSKGKELANDIVTDKCENCGAQNQIHLHVFQKYAHVFWIPFFPIGKTGVSECNNCKQVLKLKQMPSALRMSYDNLKSQTKTPIWMFAGLALIAVLVISGVISDREKDKKNAQLIVAPKAGDIFEIKTKDNRYTIYKVYKVEGDSVFIQTNNFEVNTISGIADLKTKEYSDEYYGFSKNELKEMLKKGEIIDIERR